MKTVFFESLRYKLITKKDFYYGSCPDIHMMLFFAATQHIRSKLLPLADQYKGRITFALSNEESYEDEVKTVGLEDSGENVNAALFTHKLKSVLKTNNNNKKKKQ